MKNHFKTGMLSLLLVSPTLMASTSDFCPGSQCTSVWKMAGSTPSYDNHGQRWISCDPSNDIHFDGPNGVLIIKYNHAAGDYEHTCYTRFNTLNMVTHSHPEFAQHGYITATITITGKQAASELKNRIWPAFWMTGPAWPAFGEIDMAEYMGTIQNLTTNTNLHGGPSPGHNDPHPYAIRYNASGLGDIGVTHTYGVEWEKANNGYWLRVYLIDNNVRVFSGQTFLSSNKGTYPDAAIIKGLTENDGNSAMRLVFDADDIGSLGGDGAARNQPALNYQMKIENVQAYVVK